MELWWHPIRECSNAALAFVQNFGHLGLSFTKSVGIIGVTKALELATKIMHFSFDHIY